MVVNAAAVFVSPVDGWGYMETIDGELASPFEVFLDEVGIDVGGGIFGWRGRVTSAAHKYSGMAIKMTPRHVDWSGVVVVLVNRDEDTVFSGMADTIGLECNWK
jgi:hypothetical protein